MNEFNQEDYTMPKDLVEKESIKNIEGKPAEKIEEELEQEKTYLENIDTISHKNDYKSEAEYTEELIKIAEQAKNQNIEDILKNKIYYQGIKNLINHQEQALSILFEKYKVLKIEDYVSAKELENKQDEISERKMVLERHLYDLKNYITEDIGN